MKFERFYRDLFVPDREESRGDYLLIRGLELLMVCQIVLFSWSWYVYLPRLSEVVNPIGLANYLDVSFLFDPLFAGLNAMLITLFAVSGFAGKGRYSYAVVLLLFHLQYVARFSQGAIGHGTNLTGMVLLSFALAALFFHREELKRRIAFGFSLFFTGIGYISAALSKLIGSGPFWPDGGHLYLWMGERSVDRLSQHGVFEFNMLQNFLFEHYWFATLLLTFGLVVELCGFLLWFRKTRWIQATLLLGMHLGILLVMNINFGPYMAILFLIGYPWNEWIDRFRWNPQKALQHRHGNR